MCFDDPKVNELPLVLQDIVYMFAYNLPKTAVQYNLQTLLEINSWQLPFFFFRTKIWSWHWKTFLPNPCKEFMPIEYYCGTFRAIFDEDAVYCFLLGLDFRMRNVRAFGNRAQWERRILQSWRHMDSLANFYWMVMRSKTRVLRKTRWAERT